MYGFAPTAITFSTISMMKMGVKNQSLSARNRDSVEQGALSGESMARNAVDTRMRSRMTWSKRGWSTSSATRSRNSWSGPRQPSARISGSGKMESDRWSALSSARLRRPVASAASRFLRSSSARRAACAAFTCSRPVSLRSRVSGSWTVMMFDSKMARKICMTTNAPTTTTKKKKTNAAGPVARQPSYMTVFQFSPVKI